MKPINQNYGLVPDTARQIQNWVNQQSGYACRVCVAGPDLIEWLISKDTHNRKKVPGNVSRILEDILNDKWFITNQGVGITKSGFIIDGGHRLEAIRQSGYKPVKFLLACNLDDEAQAYVDRHQRRHMSDILSLVHDTTVSKRYVAVINAMAKAKRGFSSNLVKLEEISEIWEERHWAIQALDPVPRISTLAAPVVAAMSEVYYRCSEDQRPRVLEFASQVATGEMIGHGDPAFALRGWLAGRGKANASEAKEKYYKARNAVQAFLEGRTMFKLYATITD